MGGVMKVLVSPFATALGLFNKPKQQQQQLPLPTPNRNSAADAAAKNDLLARRRGVSANQVMGAQGEEARVGGKTQLGQ